MTLEMQGLIQEAVDEISSHLGEPQCEKCFDIVGHFIREAEKRGMLKAHEADAKWMEDHALVMDRWGTRSEAKRCRLAATRFREKAKAITQEADK